MLFIERKWMIANDVTARGKEFLPLYVHSVAGRRNAGLIRDQDQCGKTPKCGNTPSRQTERTPAHTVRHSGDCTRGNVMNERLLEISAYAAFAFVAVSIIVAASMIADRLA
jgi:hypothetical protein